MESAKRLSQSHPGGIFEQAAFMVKEWGDGISSQAALRSAGTTNLHRTEEGRELLRRALIAYLDQIPFGLRKISSVIADEQRHDQREEDDRTRSALKRWAFDGQDRLWKKDEVKSLRVLGRLETMMMSFDNIAAALVSPQRFADGAALKEGLSTFFGAMPGTVPPPIEAGLYSERRAIHGLEDDNGWRFGFSRCYLRADGSGTTFLTDTFNLITREGEPPRLQNWMSGYSYFTKQGTLMRFLVSRDDPTRRRIDSLHKTEWSAKYMTFSSAIDAVFISRRDELGVEDDEMDFEDRWARDHGNLVITALVRDHKHLALVQKLIT